MLPLQTGEVRYSGQCERVCWRNLHCLFSSDLVGYLISSGHVSDFHQSTGSVPDACSISSAGEHRCTSAL
ncbi:hypothetical protein BsWGS_22751 [Bradybaena similaris]